MTFGVLNPEKIWHKILQVCLFTSPVRCSHCTLGNPKSHIYTLDYLCYLRRKKTIIHLPIPPESVTTLTCGLHNFFIWLKVYCVLSNVGGSEESQLWVVVSGSEKNRLWCVATGLSGKQCHSKCLEWPPSKLIHASSFFDSDQSHSTLRCAEIQPMSQEVATASLNTSISIHALLL